MKYRHAHPRSTNNQLLGKKTLLSWILAEFLTPQVARNLTNIRLSHIYSANFRRPENLRRIRLHFRRLAGLQITDSNLQPHNHLAAAKRIRSYRMQSFLSLNRIVYSCRFAHHYGVGLFQGTICWAIISLCRTPLCAAERDDRPRITESHYIMTGAVAKRGVFNARCTVNGLCVPGRPTRDRNPTHLHGTSAHPWKSQLRTVPLVRDG